MLSAFTPEPIHELRPKDKVKIESLLAYGDRLLVGVNTGSLRVYRVNDPRTTPAERDEGDSQPENGEQPPAKVKAVELLREVEKFSKKPVQQLAIPRTGILSDQQGNYVWVVGEGNKAEQRRVQLGQSTPATAVIAAGLKEGETVVVDGVQRVRAGIVVNPAPAGAPPSMPPVAPRT